MTVAREQQSPAGCGLVLLTLIWSYSWIAMKQVTLYIGAFDFYRPALYFSARLC